MNDHDYLCSCLAELGLTMNAIDMVLVTHEHLDHVGGLPHMPKRVVVAAHGRAASKLALGDQFSMMGGLFNLNTDSVHVDLHLADGSLVDLGGIQLKVIYSPGHCSGAICLYEVKRGILFTGDTVFAGGILGGNFRLRQYQRLYPQSAAFVRVPPGCDVPGAWADIIDPHVGYPTGHQGIQVADERHPEPI